MYAVAPAVLAEPATVPADLAGQPELGLCCSQISASPMSPSALKSEKAVSRPSMKLVAYMPEEANSKHWLPNDRPYWSIPPARFPLVSGPEACTSSR